MPIANCFIKNNNIKADEINNMVDDWAELIGVDTKDICINLLTGFIQLGQNYDVLVNLYLPSLWPYSDREHIQLTLLAILSKYLKTTTDKIFIMTSIVESSHVVENGEIVKW